MDLSFRVSITVWVYNFLNFFKVIQQYGCLEFENFIVYENLLTTLL